MDLTTIVVTAAATLFVGVVGALVASRLQAETEQKKWLRDRRYEACATLLKSIDWADLNQKVDAKRPKALAAPADLYAELDVLGMDAVSAAAQRANEALREIDIQVSQAKEFDSDLYHRLQAVFDERRHDYVVEVRKALGIKAI